VHLAPAFRYSFSPPSALATGCFAGFGFLLLGDMAAGIRDSVCIDLYVDRIAELKVTPQRIEARNIL